MKDRKYHCTLLGDIECGWLVCPRGYYEVDWEDIRKKCKYRRWVRPSTPSLQSEEEAET